MSNSEIKIPSDRQIESQADIFKALSNPSRLKIFLILLSFLSEEKGCLGTLEMMEGCQLKMAERLGLAPSTVSHHIKELKNAGLIKLNRVGKQVDISIRYENLESLKEFFKT